MSADEEKKTQRARQIPLVFSPPPPRLARNDFVIGERNLRTIETLDGWLASDERMLAISGPPASGKTHLASIAAAALGCELAAVSAEGAAPKPRIDAPCFMVDGVERAPAPVEIFDLIEDAKECGFRLILVGRGRTKDWAGGLVDLETRLAAMPQIQTKEPDEDLLAAVIDKMLRDRQLRLSQPIGRYAAPRLMRTFAAAQAFVGALDAAAAENKAPIGLKLAREVLANLSEEAFRA